MERPYFSIITVSYQAGDALLSTVKSVLRQSFSSLELIVKDAGSTDGSLEALSNIDDARLRITVGADRGIYDAMNEAIALASGRALCFMNCGDSFSDSDVLSDIQKALERSGYGDTDEPDVLLYGDLRSGGVLCRQPERMTDLYLYRRPLNHQSIFFGRGTLEKHGIYDTEYKTRADHELTLRAWRGGTPFLHVKRVVCEYEGGGFSELPDRRAERRAELEMIRKKYFTATERRRYDALLFFSMRRLRGCIAGKRSPRWLKRVYSAFAGLFNR